MRDPKTDAGFRQHVEERRFNIAAQAVVDLATGDTLHDEWLVRFDADVELTGLLRPAEISGAISTLDISMMEHAVKTLNMDRRRNPIAVNISGASMDDPKFEHLLFGTLDKLTTNPQRLVIELTETWNLHELEPAVEILKKLRARGHSICLDDVGAGAASIRYLRAFETDWLKLDGEFVQAAMSNDRDLVILKAILALKQPLGAKTIAEGVEDDAAIEFAKSLGFDAAQGYAFGQPRIEPIRGLSAHNVNA